MDMTTSRQGWASRSVERYARRPLRRSPLFAVLLIFLLVAMAYAVWIVTSFWPVLPSSGRFEIVVVLLTSPLPLLLGIQQQRLIRAAAPPDVLHVTVLTFAIIAWSYACLVMVLHVLLATLAAS